MTFKLYRNRASALAALAAASLLAAGCQLTAQRRERVQDTLTEESRALTSAVVDVLHDQPAEQRDMHTTTALQLASQDQRIEGLPSQPIDALALLQTNETAVASLRQRFALQNKLIAQQRTLTTRLVELGAEKEATDRAARLRWTKLFTLGLGSLATFVAIAIFCPVLIPLLGRLLGWVVGKLPSLAKATGVVSVKAFDAVVRGIEQTKEQFSAPTAARILAANTGEEGDSRRANPDFNAVLLGNLSRELDADHKALVRLIRAELSR